MNTELRYPNQFLIGSSHPKALSDWQRVVVTPAIKITAHPGLNVCRASKGDQHIVLLGYIIDPQRPQASDQEIVDELAGLLIDKQRFYNLCNACGGRWAMLYSFGQGAYRLACDATGLRQVFYTDPPQSRELWLASQPRMLAELCGYALDPAATALIDTYAFRSYTEFRWPGALSPYREVLHLLPNHWLDLSSGQCHRFWPDAPIPEVSLEDAVEKVSHQLKGFMQAAASRFDLAVSLTAGLDSRVVLAASRDICDKTSIMTVRQIDKPDQHPDVETAGQILSMVGQPHDVVKSSLLVDDDFVNIFKKNTALPHYIYLSDAQAILRRYERRKVVAVGSVSEVGRLSFRAQLGKPETEEITPQDLAKLQKMAGQPYAVKAFEAWLKDLDLHNVPLLDLFEWEQGHGCWLAMCQLEFDIAWRDLFAPFNCRDLLVTLLGVDARHRDKPHYTVYRSIIERLWPELLDVPINPHEKRPFSLNQLIRSKVPYPIKKILKRAMKR